MISQDILNKFYGVMTNSDEQPVNTTIQSTATQIFKINPGRLAFTIINTGTQNIYLINKNNPSATNGIFLANNGGSVSLKLLDDFGLVTNEWWAIAASATTTITVVTSQIE